MLFNKEHRILVLSKYELNRGGMEIFKAGGDLVGYIPGSIRKIYNANIVIVYGDLGEESAVIKNRYGFNCPTEIPEYFHSIICDLIDVNVGAENEELGNGPAVLSRFRVNDGTRAAASMLPMVKVDIVHVPHIWEAV